MVDLSKLPVVGRLLGGKPAEGATPPPDPEPKPLEPTSEVKPLVEEPPKEPVTEVTPTTSTVEGVQAPPETPEG